MSDVEHKNNNETNGGCAVGCGGEAPDSHGSDAEQPRSTTKPPKKRGIAASPDGWSTGNLILLCVLVSVVSQLVGISVYDRYFAQKIVAIDIKGFISEQRGSFLQGKIDEQGLKKKFDDLEAAVIAVPKNKVILMGDAVVRNVDVIKP